MRELGLYALLYGTKKTSKRFGYEEQDLKKLVIQAFDDPFIHVYREIVKASIIQAGELQTANTFKISLEALRIFMNENNIKPDGNYLGFLNFEEWYLSDYF